MRELKMDNTRNLNGNTPSSGRLYEGKYATYFSTMNPLAARIYEDISKVEDKCPNFSTLSYDEKCSVIDKHLLSPTTEQNTSHTTALLLSVYPKKPVAENYSDDSSSCDRGNSGRFSSCTESQIESCNLAKLLKRVTLLTKKKQQYERSSMNKKTKAPAPKPNNNIMVSKSSTESFSDEILTTTNHFTSVNDSEIWHHMNHMDDNKRGNNFKCLASSTLTDMKYSNNEPVVGHKFLTRTETHDNDDEDRLPQQKQNSDLIAELQAKLKRKDSGDQGGSGKHHVLKPKAPPPPPPSQKMGKTGNGTSSKEMDKSFQKPLDAQDEFVVDVSSPCRIATPKTGFDFLDNW